MSERDHAVLHAIFNPSMPLQDIPLKPPASNDSCQKRPVAKKRSADDEPTRRSRQLQYDAILACDQHQNPSKALELLNQAVEIPYQHVDTLTAARNNRAQVRRILKDNDGALEDLNFVLENVKTGGDAVASQAFTQRGLLLRLMGDDETATQDFQAAAELGCAFAKKMTSETNPYAAMCNQMLMKMFANLREGKAEDAGFEKTACS